MPTNGRVNLVTGELQVFIQSVDWIQVIKRTALEAAKEMSGFMVGPYYWSKNSTLSSGDASWSSNSTSAYTMSMNSLSFCLLATSILILMFLIMAIFERLLRSTQPSESSPTTAAAAREEHRVYSTKRIDSARPYETASDTFVDLSVLMPGGLCPTHLARPAPLPCPREGVLWPSQPPRALLAPSP